MSLPAIISLLIANTFVFATPLIFAGLGGTISEKSGVVNIGLEGMMTIGALIGATVGYYTKNPWLAFLCAGLSGAIFGWLHGIISITFGGDQIISGIAINFLGPGLAIFLARIFFDGATQTKAIELQDKLPVLFDNVFGNNVILKNLFSHYASVYLSLILVAVVWVFFYKTKYGIRLIATGENPKAAETLNINVFRIRYIAVIVSGFLAGLGGGAMSLAVVSSFSPTIISGQGFIALVAMIFGKWTPHGTLLGCLFFGFAQAIAIYLPSTGIQISSNFIAMVPYIATLLILIIFGGKSKAPSADGVPYIKDDITL